jgi:hypothetical protein
MNMIGGIIFYARFSEMFSRYMYSPFFLIYHSMINMRKCFIFVKFQSIYMFHFLRFCVFTFNGNILYVYGEVNIIKFKIFVITKYLDNKICLS